LGVAEKPSATAARKAAAGEEKASALMIGR
jgi:hypothetical protein